MTTILGHHISLIRPSRPRNPIIYKSDLPRPKYNGRSKVVKESSGKVSRVLVKLWDDAVFGVPVPATHLDILEKFEISYCIDKAVGWELENGNEIWR